MKSGLFIVLSVCAIIVPILFSWSSLTTSVVYAAITALLLYLVWSRNNAIVFLLTFVFGTATEIYAAHLGILTFAHPDVFGVPAWLSFSWGDTALVVIWLKERLDMLKQS